MNAEKYTITNLTRYLNKIPDILIRATPTFVGCFIRTGRRDY